jgi:hypothetical protein
MSTTQKRSAKDDVAAFIAAATAAQDASPAGAEAALRKKVAAQIRFFKGADAEVTEAEITAFMERHG